MIVRALYVDGVFKPLEKVDLEEGTEVLLEIKPLPRERYPDRQGGVVADAETPRGVPFVWNREE